MVRVKGTDKTFKEGYCSLEIIWKDGMMMANLCEVGFFVVVRKGGIANLESKE